MLQNVVRTTTKHALRFAITSIEKEKSERNGDCQNGGKKKEAGNKVLSELGTNQSQFINDVYNYVIKNQELPSLPNQPTSPKRNLQAAIEFIDSIPMPVNWFSVMTDDEIRHERFLAKGFISESNEV
ncbi:MAG: hypothetical protein FWD45_05555 [Coriobacteriia bacterium]|nr:hypothetical protein [Coriobacteriia bacterium]